MLQKHELESFLLERYSMARSPSQNQIHIQTFLFSLFSQNNIPMISRKKRGKKGKTESKTKIYIVFPNELHLDSVGLNRCFGSQIECQAIS